MSILKIFQFSFFERQLLLANDWQVQEKYLFLQIIHAVMGIWCWRIGITIVHSRIFRIGLWTKTQNWFQTENKILWFMSHWHAASPTHFSQKTSFDIWGQKKVSLMLSKLWLLKEKKRREEDRMRARDRGARKGTVKQTQKPLALVVKAKWLSNVNTTGTWHGHRLTTYCCFLPYGLDNTYAFSAPLITEDTHT